MKRSVWMAVLMMVVGVGMLVAGIGAAVMWMAVITAGVALVVIDLSRPGTSARL
jgi:hypothetical protein